MSHTRLQNVERSQNVDRCVLLRFADTDGNAGLSCLMTDGFRLECGKSFFHGDRVLNVHLEELSPCGNIVAASAAQVIEDGDLPASGQRLFRDVTSDESGTAGDEQLHFQNSRDQP